jgi:hypothetical protein
MAVGQLIFVARGRQCLLRVARGGGLPETLTRGLVRAMSGVLACSISATARGGGVASITESAANVAQPLLRPCGKASSAVAHRLGESSGTERSIHPTGRTGLPSRARALTTADDGSLEECSFAGYRRSG